ncbi:hypothetical protein [Arundinibacter roseus]|uniref:Uncharacterized protein n=1 Tax=Arundinibacter roseus TaxID=2070510 RepID=A0A4R4KGE1_9BACT|nr:hypothetical protein [Arundinibacter roseus]TDB67120.1 hypothetical protein EZE20_08380 [Arundinibacter roseus]
MKKDFNEGLPTSIETRQDAIEFLQQIIIIEKANYHPDDDFEDYERYGSGKPMYSPGESAQRNKLNAQALDLIGDELYDMAIQMIKRYFGLQT